jgi:hypothetical protein
MTRSCPRSRQLRRLFGICFGANAVTFATQAYDLGLTKKYKLGRRRRRGGVHHLPVLGQKIEGFVGVNRYIPVLDAPLEHAHHRKFYDDAVVRLKQIDPSGPLPDRYVQSELRGGELPQARHAEVRLPRRADTMKLIEALEGLESKEDDDFPQATRRSARRTTRPSSASSSSTSRTASTHLEVVPRKDRPVPPACKFA